MMRIGFVLLTHAHPDQIETLTRVLSDLYDSPPIVCHHDFSQCRLERERFGGNVRFVQPHLKTYWGCFSIIPATRAALRLLLEKEPAPDWIYLLSGSDYPSASPDEVRRMLSETPYDAFIDHREITWKNQSERMDGECATGFDRPSYLAKAYQRYRAVAVPRPAKTKPFAIPPVGRSYLYHPLWRILIPGTFSRRFRCYAGEHWFTVNRRAAEVLVQETDDSRRLMAHLSRRESPEECFYHSMLGNDGSLRVSRRNLRYIDWPTANAWHPKTLTMEDLPAILGSGAHFARKIAPGSEVAEALDRVLGVSAKSRNRAANGALCTA